MNHYKILQMPNVPLLVWFFATFGQLLYLNSFQLRILQYLAFGALFTWGWLELFQGDNYFRRGLGLVVLLGALWLRA